LKDFNETIVTERTVFVHFYTDWCAYCSSLNPVLEEVAQELHRMSINITIGRIDVTHIDSDQLMAATESISIVGYPTLLLYRDGRRITEYHGSRTAKDMVDYLKLKANCNVHSIRSFEEMMPFISQFELGELYEKGIFALVLGVFPNALHSRSDSLSIMEGDGASSTQASSDGDRARIFLDVAANFEYALFFLSQEASLLEYFNFPDPWEDKVLVFQEFNEDMYKVLAVNASTSSLDIIDFLLIESLPVSIPFNPDTQPILSYLPIKSHALIFCEQVECENDQLAQLVDRLSLGYKGKLVFVEVGPEHYQLLSFFQVKLTALPQLIIANMTIPTGMAKYSFSDFLLFKPSDATSKYREATSGTVTALLFNLSSSQSQIILSILVI
jgi:thiol-disulfide isomerase/thioredoxin